MDIARRGGATGDSELRCCCSPEVLSPIMHDMLIPLALVATVLLVSGLVSSAVQRAPFSMPMLFLGLGLLLGDGGVGALHVDMHNEGLAALAILSLAFVLFLDAVNTGSVPGT